MKTSKLTQDRQAIWLGEPLADKAYELKIRADFPKVHKFIGSPATFAVYSNNVLSVGSILFYNRQTFKVTLIKKSDRACPGMVGVYPYLTSKTRYYEFKAEIVSSSLEAACLI